MRDYLLISFASILLLISQHPTWDIVPIQTIYNYDNGRPAIVIEGRFIDSLGLCGWDDITVVYPITQNDSDNVHKVFLDSNEIIH